MIDSTQNALSFPPARPQLRRSSLLRDGIDTAILIALVYTLVNLATVRFFIEGPSMQPSFYEGQYILVSRAHYLLGEPARGDIAVIDPPGDDGTRNEPLLIKRLIGLPGERISLQDGMVYINDTLLDEPYTREACTSATCSDRTWQLAPGEYFFMGDNRNNSRDSRAFGAIARARIIGEAVIRYWPPTDWDVVTRYRFPNP